ncbi:flocculation protein FLO11-like [Diachasma alloeum]|uniref:flocculation protein FLO11-like n=1 Tax=Diachasma alloeum TaxID=454923 RepID=UPI0007383625|nr:flocculation protein FLO11-like [Diachasma alloeum]
MKWNLPHQPQQPNPKTALRATNLSRYQSTEAMPETQPLTNRPIPSRTLSTPAIRPNPSPTPSQVTPTNRGANHRVPVTVYPPSQPPTQSQRLHSREEVPTQARLGPTRGQTYAESAAKRPRTSPTHHALQANSADPKNASKAHQTPVNPAKAQPSTSGQVPWPSLPAASANTVSQANPSTSSKTTTPLMPPGRIMLSSHPITATSLETKTAEQWLEELAAMDPMAIARFLNKQVTAKPNKGAE